MSKEQAQAWWQVTALEGGAVEVAIDGVIDGWDFAAKDFVRDFRAIEADSITVRINSPGGYIDDGMAIFNAIAEHPATVTAIVDPLAASAAAYLAMAADRVEIQSNGRFMLHSASTVVAGNRRDMQSAVDALDIIDANMAEAFSSRMGNNADDVLAIFAEGDKYYSAQDAVDAGLADAIRGAADDVGDAPDATALAGDIRAAALKKGHDMAIEQAQRIAAQAEEITDIDGKIDGVADQVDDQPVALADDAADDDAAPVAMTDREIMQAAATAGVPELAVALMDMADVSEAAVTAEIGRVKDVRAKMRAAGVENPETIEKAVALKVSAELLAEMLTEVKASISDAVDQTGAVEETAPPSAVERGRAIASYGQNKEQN